MEYTAVVIATPIASERIAKTVKSGVAPSRLRASLMSLTTGGSVASLVAQGPHAADAHLLTMDTDFLPLRGRAGWSITVLDDKTGLPRP